MSDTVMPVEANEKPVRKTLPVQSFASHASAGGLYKIWIGNILLNIITLGIYSFWGRTRMRKYAASHIMLAGSPLEYTGTGGELFAGFLKAYAVLLVVFGSAGILMSKSIFLGLLVELLIIPLIYAGIYLSYRYRLSRLNWKAIRFGLGGTVKDFIKSTIGSVLLSICTLGILLPRVEMKLWSGIMNNAHFGSQKFEFQGDYKKLMGVHLLTLLICAVMFIPGLVLLAAPTGMEMIKKAGGESNETLAPVFMLLGFILIIFSRIPRCWYKAKLWKAQLIGLRLGGLRFKSSATGFDFVGLSFGNALIIIFTLGLGYPFVIKRNLSFQTKYTIVAGELNETILQAEKQKTGIGDLMAPDLDFSGGLDIGL